MTASNHALELTKSGAFSRHKCYNGIYETSMDYMRHKNERVSYKKGWFLNEKVRR